MLTKVPVPSYNLCIGTFRVLNSVLNVKVLLAQRQLRYIEWKGEKIMIFKKLHFPLISSFILQG